ncbi:hypothetical protein SDC9_119204 [bioreactor metagenome]|uniref:Uncharacterized protein n=1 Tax=bioreactor metagenome TaxID=1076179 RepID=A0A645C5H5_9ZZZZ
MHTHAMADEHSICPYFQIVAPNRGPVELLHQGLGKFSEGIAENDNLGQGSEFIEEGKGSLHRSHRGDDCLDVRERKLVLGKYLDPVRHQFVVIRLFSGGDPQLLDTRPLSYIDPNFRYQYPFHIKTDNIHDPSSVKASITEAGPFMQGG